MKSESSERAVRERGRDRKRERGQREVSYCIPHTNVQVANVVMPPLNSSYPHTHASYSICQANIASKGRTTVLISRSLFFILTVEVDWRFVFVKFGDQRILIPHESVELQVRTDQSLFQDH